MVNPFTDISLFIGAVWAHVLTLVAGCVVTYVLGMIEKHVLKRSVSLRVEMGILCAFVLFACFQAWRDQYDIAESKVQESDKLNGENQKDSAKITSLQNLLESKDRPVILQNIPSPEIAELLKRQAQQLSKLKSESLSPKKTALQLSNDILSFYGEQLVKEPRSSIPRAGTPDDAQRQMDQDENLHQIWLHEAVATYEVRFGARISSTLNDIRAAGIDPKGVEGCISPVANSFLIQQCGARIGGLAEKLPN